MQNKNIVLMEGEVVEALPNAFFKVKLNGGGEIIAHLSGKMRINHIKVAQGDRVSVEMNEYNKEKGRIVRRL
ncbi:MAG: translation initiation factor IF-1 [Parcubacteria group bacterium GW2011_GWA2_38_13b]|nr:MAG: translation initiation factor IF-1 [Parcubacteria group bacterium GW2011_GWA2_38_13b]